MTVLGIPGCPHAASATELALDAVASTGLKARPSRSRFATTHAEQFGFTGSPSFHLDGHDLFPQDVPPSVACRIYLGPDSQGGIPSLGVLARALREAGAGG